MTVVLLAALPTALYSWLLWRLDRYEHEPMHLLAASFVWGALPALTLAALAELRIGVAIGDQPPGLETTVIAPLVEEPVKALALIALFVFVRREFNGLLDGIVYGALIGFGFAMSENLLYFLAHRDQLATVWVLRSVVFGFNHAFYTSIVGIVLGLIRLDRRRWLGYAALPAALTLAILLHAAHNASVQMGMIGIGLAWLVDSGGVLMVLLTAVLAQKRERHWLQTQLAPEIAAAVIDPRDLQAAASPSLRWQDDLRVLLTQGWLPYRRRRRFHNMLVKLAFVKHQLAHGDRFCCQDDVDRLRAALVAQRALVHGSLRTT